MQDLNPLNRNLKISLVDAFLYSLMVGAGETYLPAYAMSLGFGEIFAGLLTTWPMVSAAFVQLIAPHGIEKLKSVKHWVVFSALLQALTYLPLIYFTLAQQTPDVWTMFAILTLYWGASLAITPAWNFWMGHLVPTEKSQAYFALRNRIFQLGVLLGLLIGGVSLHFDLKVGPFTSVFSLLFIFAFACRIFSTIALSIKFYHQKWTEKVPAVKFSGILQIFNSHPSRKKFFMSLVPFQVSVFVSAPFVTPLILGELKVNYLWYMLAVSALFVGKMAATGLMRMGYVKLSNSGLFKLGVLMVIPSPLMWLVSQNVYYIFLIQFFGGLAWGFYEVGMSLLIYQDIPSEDKISVLSMNNLLNSFAALIGTGLGGILLKNFGISIAHYLSIFALGSLGRLVFGLWAIHKQTLWAKSLKSEEVVSVSIIMKNVG